MAPELKQLFMPDPDTKLEEDIYIFLDLDINLVVVRFGYNKTKRKIFFR